MHCGSLNLSSCVIWVRVLSKCTCGSLTCINWFIGRSQSHMLASPHMWHCHVSQLNTCTWQISRKPPPLFLSLSLSFLCSFFLYLLLPPISRSRRPQDCHRPPPHRLVRPRGTPPPSAVVAATAPSCASPIQLGRMVVAPHVLLTVASATATRELRRTPGQSRHYAGHPSCLCGVLLPCTPLLTALYCVHASLATPPESMELERPHHWLCPPLSPLLAGLSPALEKKLAKNERKKWKGKGKEKTSFFLLRNLSWTHVQLHDVAMPACVTLTANEPLNAL